jgi:predicted transcriptional regulator
MRLEINHAGENLKYRNNMGMSMDKLNTSTTTKRILHDSLCEQLIQLGLQTHTASVLTCLHFHGASTSRDLQTWCNLRQPDVSIAINELREMNLIIHSPINQSNRGRPAHMYRLRHTLEQSLQPFIRLAQARAAEILSGVDSIQKIVESISNEQSSKPMAV